MLFVATNNHHHVWPVLTGALTGSFSDTEPDPDASAGQSSNVERLWRTRIAWRCDRKSDDSATITPQKRQRRLYPGAATATNGQYSLPPYSDASVTAVQHSKSDNINATATQTRHRKSRHSDAIAT